MNPFKKITGCMVPHCESILCNREIKKICELRKLFLIEQVEKRQELRRRSAGYLSSKSEEILKREIYFWRNYDSKKAITKY